MTDENEIEYEFFLGTFFYRGTIISENETHWLVNDRKEGPIELPKGSATRRVVYEKVRE